MKNYRRKLVVFAPIATIAIATGFSACGGGDGGASTFDAGGGGDGTGGDAIFGTDAPPLFGDSVLPTGPFSDFPAAPVLDMPDGGVSAPANAATLFGAASQGAQSGGPCLVEPEIGSLYPQNWLRPRFHWIAASGENLFELRLHAMNQTNDLVVYTTDVYWTMPKTMWTSFAAHSADQPMTVTVRGGVLASSMLTMEALGSSGDLGIAPVSAPGTIVYWTTSGGSSLKGFSIGDESVSVVMTPPQVTETSATCIGCHTSTPDGDYVEFTTQGPWGNAIGSVQTAMTGATPPFLSAAASTALEQSPRGISATSKAHWANGDHIVVTTFNDSTLSWVDLEATTAGAATGVFTRTGDPSGGAAPTWSHDGNTIVYVSTNAITTGRLDNGAADLYSIPYANKDGGTATMIPGASIASVNEYYPIFSPDDAWLAFDSIPVNTQMYNQPLAEVSVIPAAGGTATRLVANDPPACTGKVSPGVTNSWPKWAPGASTASGGRTFYWIVFSSTRDEAGNPQLYVSPVVVDSAGMVTTYHALYLWNQPSDENNHTPAWDTFNIPPVPPPP
jgi:WD40-like Beta Propeller Repeat